MGLFLHALNLAFAKIPIGVHTVWTCLAISLIAALLSFSIRLGVSTIIPFEAIFVGALTFIIGNVLYGMIKFIRVKDKETGLTKRWAIGTFARFLDKKYFLCSHILSLNNNQYRNMASHAGITSVRSQSKSCRKVLLSNNVRIQMSLNINIFLPNTFDSSTIDNLPSPSVWRTLLSAVSSFSPILLFKHV